VADRLHVGIVGLGFGQRVLLPAFQTAAGCAVVGVSAGAWDHAREVADRHGIPVAYRDWQALVADPGIDAVVVATPPHLHDEIATAALNLKKHVFCEKPLAASLASAQSMAAAAAAAGTANMVDFEFPEMAAWQEARRILASGSLGRTRHVRVSWYGETYANRFGLRSWKTQVSEGGGVLNDFVPHCFHYLEWLVGPVRQVWTAPVAEYDRRTGADTIAVLSLEIGAGSVASISVHTAAIPGDGHSISIHADEGTLLLNNPRTDTTGRFALLVATRDSGRFEPVTVDSPPEESPDYRVPAAGRLIDRFVRWAIAGVPSRPNFADGLRVQTLLDAAWRSRAEGAGCHVPVRTDPAGSGVNIGA
jgi:predicted dehydrogenase